MKRRSNRERLAPPVEGILDRYDRIIGCLARLSYKAVPKGKRILAKAWLKLSLSDNVVSIYGPTLAKNWEDATFEFCATGEYGTWFSDFLAGMDTDFSFIDVGANIGLYTFIAEMNPHCRKAYSFEPNPHTFERLKKNAVLNTSEAVLLNVGINAHSGSCSMYYDPSHSGRAGLRSDGQEIEAQFVDRGFLDQIEATDGHHKLVKIDVEGWEPVVIGELAGSTIIDSVDHVYYEVNEDMVTYEERVRMETVLTERGFKLVHREGRGQHYNLMFSRRRGRRTTSRGAPPSV